MSVNVSVAVIVAVRMSVCASVCVPDCERGRACCVNVMAIADV